MSDVAFSTWTSEFLSYDNSQCHHHKVFSMTMLTVLLIEATYRIGENDLRTVTYDSQRQSLTSTVGSIFSDPDYCQEHNRFLYYVNISMGDVTTTHGTQARRCSNIHCRCSDTYYSPPHSATTRNLQ